jgi:cell division protein FtsA
MSQKTDSLLTVLDVGSAKTRVLVAELHDGALRYRGHGVADSTGLRKGLIADLKQATQSINKAATAAEAMAQGTIDR